MTQIAILSGIYSDLAGNIRVSLPINLEPVIVDSGISKGYLRFTPGATTLATGPGPDRGAINWNGVCYRVMGTKLCTIVGQTVTILGDVGPGGPVSMDYSVDRLAIASGGNLFYYNAAEGITQVTDPDLGVALDVLWIDGYFCTTDGTSIVVTDLNDPYSVNPIDYGSSEEDPDPIVGLKKTRDEIYVLNRYTIENFSDIGNTSGEISFPFQRNPGGLIETGSVGTKASTLFLETFAFVGSPRNAALSVFLAGAGTAINISTPEIDRQIAALTDAEQALIEVESRVETGEQRLYVHLPTKSLVYSRQASVEFGKPIWHILAGGVTMDQAYPARHFALASGKWICGSQTGQVGYLDETTDLHFGAPVGTQFDTPYNFNATNRFIVRVLELIGLQGNAPFGSNPTCFMSMTEDGLLWGQERALPLGTAGQRSKRVQWRPGRLFSNFCSFRFRTANVSKVTWARLEGDIEALSS